MKKILMNQCLAVAAWLAAGSALAAHVEAKKDGVEVFADATNKSAVVTTLKAGETVAAGERKGMFWSVTTTAGKAGFVSVLVVKHKPDADGGLVKVINFASKEGRAEGDGTDARTRSAVMGVRGLSDDDNVANAANIRPNLRAVYRMEDKPVTEKKMEQLGQQIFKEIASKAAPSED